MEGRGHEVLLKKEILVLLVNLRIIIPEILDQRRDKLKEFLRSLRLRNDSLIIHNTFKEIHRDMLARFEVEVFKNGGSLQVQHHDDGEGGEGEAEQFQDVLDLRHFLAGMWEGKREREEE